jgi:hypothetical protein
MAKARAKERKTNPTHRQIEYFLDGEPSSLLKIIENNPDDTTWKEYLETNNLQHSGSAKRYLKEKLGDYLSAEEIHKITGTKVSSLDKLRNKGILKSVQLQGKWYYSLKSLLKAIKTADIKDLR